MDVPPCNPLLDLWLVALVLSRTLNGSPAVKEQMKNQKAGSFAGLFVLNFSFFGSQGLLRDLTWVKN